MSYPFERTRCYCPACVACCKRQPGPLALGDFERIAAYLGEDATTARQHFRASPGAVIRNALTGEIRRVGSITPDYQNGRCVFLDANDRCTVHAVAPYGCAMFDVHMAPADAHPRAVWLIHSEETYDYRALRATLEPATHYQPVVVREPDAFAAHQIAEGLKEGL